MYDLCIGMTSTATPTTLLYSEIVDVDMDSTNDVNFADVEDYGHRVIIGVDKTKFDSYFQWVRNAGSSRPSAKLGVSTEFRTALLNGIGEGFIDIDGVTGGLHFGSDNFSQNTDPRLRYNDTISINDIPLAFVLYKLYGSSSVVTKDNIFNLNDGHGMLYNEQFANAILNSFQTHESGTLDTMFRDLLAADPHRFFDASGIPVSGLFETNTDISGTGSWMITENDIIEVKVKFVFNSEVTRRGVAGYEHNITASDSDSAQQNQQTIIQPGDYFYVRVQIKAVYVPPPPPQYSVVQSSLITWFSAKDYAGTGAWVDKSTYSVSATKTVGTIAKNASGNGVVLNGSTYWSYPNSVPLTNQSYTMTAWFKRTGTPTGQAAIIGEPDTTANKVGPSMWTNGNGATNSTFVGGFANTENWNPGTNNPPLYVHGPQVSFPLNIWQNITVTWNHSTKALSTYSNNTLLSTITVPNKRVISDGRPIRIGTDWFNTAYVIGEIGEILVYNRELSVNELTSNYYATSSNFA